jgi:hypothetical protein
MSRAPAWRKRPPPPPWSPEEEAELAAMVRCGLSVDHYQTKLPGRMMGDILARRLELIEAGQVQRARML